MSVTHIIIVIKLINTTRKISVELKLTDEDLKHIASLLLYLRGGKLPVDARDTISIILAWADDHLVKEGIQKVTNEMDAKLITLLTTREGYKRCPGTTQ